MHDVFAAVRLWQLRHHMKLPEHADFHGVRLLGKPRWDHCKAEAKSKDLRDSILGMAYGALHTTGYVDDEFDNVRTRANMEMATIVYVDERLPNFDNWPLYVENVKKPDGMAGLEQTVDCVLEYRDGSLVRYVGTIDGCVVKRANGRMVLDENKTAARMDRAWRMSFDMRHQVTGYCATSSVAFGRQIMDCRLTGLKIKPTYKGEDVYVAELSRDASAIVHWGNWIKNEVETYERYIGDYEVAPRFTHSCNRFFRPCSLLPFCADTPQGRKEHWAQMVPSDLSPTERAVLE